MKKSHIKTNKQNQWRMNKPVHRGTGAARIEILWQKRHKHNYKKKNSPKRVPTTIDGASINDKN